LQSFFFASIISKELRKNFIIVPNEECYSFINGLTNIIKSNIQIDFKLNDDPFTKIINGKVFDQIAQGIDNSILNYDRFVEPDTWLSSKRPISISMPNGQNMGTTEIHSWLCMLIVGKLNGKMKSYNIFKNSEFRNRMASMIRTCGKFIPSYLKDFENMDLSDLDLSYSDFSNSIIHNTTFERSDLSHIDFSLANSLRNECSQVSFKSANMFHTDLEDSFFQKADFTDAFLWQCDLANANLEGSTFINTIFHYVRISDQTKFKDAIIEDIGLLNTPLPDNAKCFRSFLPKDNKLIEKAEGYFSKLCKPLLESNGIRYTGIVFLDNLEIYKPFHRRNIYPLLTSKDKTILIHHVWLSWKLQTHQSNAFTNPKSFVIEYEKLKVVTVRIPNENMIVFTTMNKYLDQHDIIKWILDQNRRNESNVPKFIENPIEGFEKNEINNSISIVNILGDPDKVKKVKYVAVFDIKKEIPEIVHQKGDKVFSINPDVIKDIIRRWKDRMKFENKIGKAKYAIKDYKNDTLITSINKNNLLFIVADRARDPHIHEYRKILNYVIDFSTLI